MHTYNLRRDERSSGRSCFCWLEHITGDQETKEGLGARDTYWMSRKEGLRMASELRPHSQLILSLVLESISRLP